MAESVFKAGILAHIQRLTNKGVSHEAAVSILMTSLKDESSLPICLAEIQSLMERAGFQWQHACGVVIVNNEMKKLQGKGVEAMEAVQILLSRLASAEISPRKETQPVAHNEYQSQIDTSSFMHIAGVDHRTGVRRRRKEHKERANMTLSNDSIGEMDYNDIETQRQPINKRSRKEMISSSVDVENCRIEKLEISEDSEGKESAKSASAGINNAERASKKLRIS
mmetsp:Transcript_12226/g.18300  ORF Transcript_12226/g.18300 Transcript_12226/m.18300 type:complete len:224 (-) Transcript_12226:202-873(-)|eukprot:CAMPEP_0171458978 /NCGR_PEP_ID=MMETSP0945-20130129/4445_1 /TAXON_ID=109269 /ORGANISM="Vaucheria litorea, Strain CCMP2940" /LENGTH=223 /DNA_ID=CAMNT_0011984903 /DNA_START=241 /DNA_END=912 /DNA_ORIENTATION=+